MSVIQLSPIEHDAEVHYHLTKYYEMRNLFRDENYKVIRGKLHAIQAVRLIISSVLKSDEALVDNMIFICESYAVNGLKSNKRSQMLSEIRNKREMMNAANFQ